ncbi:amino acid adenylation domain-containing protein [Bacillus mycoides]|uniref:amino acid adenylation domain-containing protein n=1 Tax=Bacillus mycoides TaxID=1405 RepID=UPI0024AD1962|nr:amino acid adenylation domain-containing protein [Bacillus mycoides]MDI6530868.1 amino acid adenylation domain-containing protein [Bacillus mycoides]WJE60246.1 amino acid adenylation domain-containing protein [Bacillus mycoides]
MKYREYFSLTHPQQRIWYMEKINPHQPLHNIGGTVKIQGEVDFDCLEKAINYFIKKNDGIRHRFVESDEKVHQYVEKYHKYQVRYTIFNSQKDLDAWVQQEAAKPFDINEQDLFDFALFKLQDTKEGGYFVKVHHIISDGWSMNLLTEQICNAYTQILKGEKITDQLNSTYMYCLEKEESYLTSKRFMKDKNFWNEKFSKLPIVKRKNEVDCAKANRKTYSLTNNQSDEIKQFATDINVSVYAFFVALYYIYLNKVNGQDDLIIGMPVLNRAGKNEKNIVGMLTSTMPFRHTVDSEMTVLDFIKGINRELVRCYYHQKYPYDVLVKDLELKKKGYGDLFDTCINYYNTKLPTEINGTPIENEEFYNRNQIYSIQLIIREWSRLGGFNLDIDYKDHMYTEKQIEQMYLGISHLLNQMLESPNKKLMELEILPEDMWNKLIYEFNATNREYPKDKTIHQLFEEQVERTPDRVAICLEDKELTYRELNDRSNQLARYILKKNVTKGTVIGISTTHSLETIIGILGILKAGAVYLPIDPQYPSERVNYMLQDSDINILFTNFDISHQWDLSLYAVEVIHINAAHIYMGDTSNIKNRSEPTDLAYIIYTSGSTGNPKGTMIEQKGLVNYISWANQVYVGASENEVFPLYSSLAFDLTVTTLFTPLISGNQIIIYPADANEYVLYRIFKEKKASIIKLTPSHLFLLKDSDFAGCSIKKIIVGGENLTVDLAANIQKKLGRETKIYNEYGPTETVVGCMIHQFDIEKDKGVSVPIGVPAQNMKIYVLDSDLRPVPMGVVGEIYISGEGVARGYFNNQDLTRERFIVNPYSEKEQMYKSGDLARFIEGDKIEYLGRKDDQVKVRGFRIELKEIEINLQKYPSIKEVVVIDQEDYDGNRYLCAYYTENAKVKTSELFRFLKEILPVYMIPSYFIVLKEIPLTFNGKLDREALPKPEVKIEKKTEGEIESDLVGIIREVLNVEKVSIRDNFYHLGGDSIKAIQISSKIREKGIKIKTKDILANPVIEDMILYLEMTSTKEQKSNQQCVGSIETIPSISWFFSQDLNNINHYTQSVLVKVKDDVEVGILESAFSSLVCHHDAFRLNYRMETKELFYNQNNYNKKIKIESLDLSELSKTEQSIRIASIGEILKSSFNIENEILLKVCIFDLGDFGKRLLMTAHHLAVDGISWRIIFEDINQLYKQIENKQKTSLPPKDNSVQDWAIELKRMSKKIPESEKRYWEHVYQYEENSFNDFDLGLDRMEFCEKMIKKLTEEETMQLLQKANEAYRTKGNELMIIALSLVMAKYIKTNDVIIEIEGHGREELNDEIDVSRTIGWFTSLFPIRLQFEDVDISQQIKQLKEQLRSVPSKGLNYGVLKYISKELSSESRKYVRFNYLGDFNATFSNGIFEFAYENSGQDNSNKNEMDCLLDIVAYTVDKKLNLSITYSKNKFKQETISQFFMEYMNQLRDLIQHCCQRKHAEFTPSDFETANLSSEDLENIFNI